MSREIKFRAWHGTAKKMLPNVGFHKSLCSDLSADDDYYKTHEEGRYIISPMFESFVLMQYTGLKDKNGKEIYEGDILIGIRKEQKDKEGKYAYQIKDFIQWNTGGFKLFGKPLQNAYTKDNNCLWQFMWHESGSFVNREGYYYQIDDIEIVGNIYQNSELLNQTA